MDPSVYYSICKSSFVKEEKKELVSYQRRGEIKQTTIEYGTIDLQNIKINLKLGNSIFKYYQSIIFANLDALSGCCKYKEGSLKLYNNSEYLNNTQLRANDEELTELKIDKNINVISAVVLGDITTGTVDYIKFRMKESVVYTLNSMGSDLGWKLDTTGPIDDYDTIIRKVQSVQNLGVDLLVDYSESDYNKSLLIALYTLFNDATWILKLTEIDINFIYSCSIFFDKIYLIRPLSTIVSDYIGNEIYLICKNKKVINGTPLENYILMLKSDNFNPLIPDDFTIWINSQIESLNKVDQANFDKYKAFILWNIPDNKI